MTIEINSVKVKTTSRLSSLPEWSRLLVKKLIQFEEYREELEVLLTELANTNISKTYFQYNYNTNINSNGNVDANTTGAINYQYGVLSNSRRFPIESQMNSLESDLLHCSFETDLQKEIEKKRMTLYLGLINLIKVDFMGCFENAENYFKKCLSCLDDILPDDDDDGEDIEEEEEKEKEGLKPKHGGQQIDFFTSLSVDMILDIITRLYRHVQILFHEYKSLITHEEILSLSETKFYSMKISYVQRTTLKKLPDFLLLQEFVK